MSFDFTVSNTGRLAGAAHLIEERLSKKRLWLPCRDHILEIDFDKAFTSV
jgi:hypothetical protein